MELLDQNILYFIYNITVTTNLVHVKSIINGVRRIIANVNIHWLYFNLLQKERESFRINLQSG
jgi:hypothetical protein